MLTAMTCATTQTQTYPGEDTDFLRPSRRRRRQRLRDPPGLGLVECAGDPSQSPTDCAVNFTSNGGYLVSARADNNLRVTRTRFNPTPPPTTSDELNFFVQDTMSIGTRWNLKLGVRAT